ncbi:TPA: hypothetical protein N0F65_009580 [Lagenidium giganteum]|uniref:Uncharacterized protein n=1 Tax=Lagenidium giganteum TaxID=4803 RepID=A0AAV2YJ36_9STRA|nr:TPA: hypothetical protein N0F65_009580 [Lagenidium giganteum]
MNTSLNYISSIRYQLETSTSTRLFKDDDGWYRHLRKSGNGKSATDDLNDLRVITRHIFTTNTKKAMKERILISQQWLVIGRSSDIGRIRYDDLQWMGNVHWCCDKAIAPARCFRYALKPRSNIKPVKELPSRVSSRFHTQHTRNKLRHLDYHLRRHVTDGGKVLPAETKDAQRQQACTSVAKCLQLLCPCGIVGA